MVKLPRLFPLSRCSLSVTLNIGRLRKLGTATGAINRTNNSEYSELLRARNTMHTLHTPLACEKTLHRLLCSSNHSLLDYPDSWFGDHGTEDCMQQARHYYSNFLSLGLIQGHHCVYMLKACDRHSAADARHLVTLTAGRLAQAKAIYKETYRCGFSPDIRSERALSWSPSIVKNIRIAELRQLLDISPHRFRFHNNNNNNNNNDNTSDAHSRYNPNAHSRYNLLLRKWKLALIIVEELIEQNQASDEIFSMMYENCPVHLIQRDEYSPTTLKKTLFEFETLVSRQTQLRNTGTWYNKVCMTLGIYETKTINSEHNNKNNNVVSTEKPNPNPNRRKRNFSSRAKKIKFN